MGTIDSVMLINPNYDGTFSKFIGLGLVRVGTVLEKAGFSVRVLDCVFSDIDPYESIKKYKPSVVGISFLNYNYSSCLKIAKFAKSYGCVVVFFGSQVNALRESLLDNSFVDFGLMGEVESTFSKLLTSLNNNGDLNSVLGLVYRDKSRVLINDGVFKTDLDKLPFPDFSLMNLDKIDDYPLVTSKGCTYKCIFCTHALVKNPVWISRSAESVVSEVLSAIKKYDVKHFLIYDDNFSFDLKRAKKIFKLLIKKGVKTNFSFVEYLRADSVDEEFLLLLKKVGCKKIGFGIESADETVFKNVNKGESLKQIKKSIILSKKLGFKVSGTFVFGLPGSSFKAEMKSLKFIKETKLDYPQWYIVLLFPGTKMYSWIESNAKILTSSFNPMLIQRSFFIEPPFETKIFTRDEIKRAWILLHLRSGNYFVKNPSVKAKFKDYFKRFVILWYVIFRYDFFRFPYYVYAVFRKFLAEIFFINKI